MQSAWDSILCLYCVEGIASHKSLITKLVTPNTIIDADTLSARSDGVYVCVWACACIFVRIYAYACFPQCMRQTDELTGVDELGVERLVLQRIKKVSSVQCSIGPENVSS